MTVCISLTNYKTAVVLTDSQVSGYNRQSNTANKSEQFIGENYQGVICGTGAANRIVSANRTAKTMDQQQSLDLFIEAMFNRFQETIDSEGTKIVAQSKKDLEKKISLITGLPKARKISMIEQDTRDAMRRYDEQLRQENQTTLLVTAYDKERHAIRVYAWNRQSFTESANTTTAAGSGADGAEVYFATRFPGIDLSRCEQRDLLFHAINAFNYSTINRGVGGSPKIMLIDEKEVSEIPHDAATALCNLSGEYLTQSENLQQHHTRQLFKDLLAEKEGTYQKIAKAAKLSVDDVTGVLIPFSSMQERANRKFYKA
jgi:hypothetical protein